MASRDVVLDVADETLNGAEKELVFQDFHHTSSGGPSSKYTKSTETVQTHTFTNFPNPDDSDSDDKAELLDEDKKNSQASFLSFEYYQSYFDVDTKQVIGRILGSVYPNPRVNYLQTHIRPKPDLYGPFWVSTTLILCIAISGNLFNYFASYNAGQDFQWQYDFHKVTIATIVIYSYWLMMPLIVYGFIRWRGNRAAYRFSELVCVYGYSLSIYIPVSILWLIPVSWIRWLLVFLGMSISGSVLAFTVWSSVKDDKKQISMFLVVFVVVMHGLLAVGFMLYFFSAVPSLGPGSTTVTTIATVTAASSTPATTATIPRFNIPSTTTLAQTNLTHI